MPLLKNQVFINMLITLFKFIHPRFPNTTLPWSILSMYLDHSFEKR